MNVQSILAAKGNAVATITATSTLSEAVASLRDHGVGALVVRRGTEIAAQIKGGGQEMGRRAGTENVIGIAGFGAAAEAAMRDLADGKWQQAEKLRNILESSIEESVKETIFVGKDVTRLPNTSCFITPGWKGETQVMAMDLAGFSISAGSACSSFHRWPPGTH